MNLKIKIISCPSLCQMYTPPKMRLWMAIALYRQSDQFDVDECGLPHSPPTCPHTEFLKFPVRQFQNVR